MGDARMLAVDVGNSEVVFGLGDDARWLARWRLSTDARRAALPAGAGGAGHEEGRAGSNESGHGNLF